jgi:hypothetical protein
VLRATGARRPVGFRAFGRGFRGCVRPPGKGRSRLLRRRRRGFPMLLRRRGREPSYRRGRAAAPRCRRDA